MYDRIRCIPENWRKCTFEVSLFDEIWIIPEKYSSRDIFEDTGLVGEFGEPSFIQSFKNIFGPVCVFIFAWAVFNISLFPEGGVVRSLAVILCVPVMPFFIVGILGVCVNIFPKILRVSLKASSLIWSPLILSLDRPLQIGNDRQHIYDYYENSTVARFSIKYSYLSVFVEIMVVIWSVSKFAAEGYVGRPTLIAVNIASGLSFIASIINIFVWEFVIRRMKYNVSRNISDNWWEVLIYAKFAQGIFSMMTIPMLIVGSYPRLTQFYLFINSDAFVEFVIRVIKNVIFVWR